MASRRETGASQHIRVFATSLGCKLNQCEVEAWSRDLASTGCTMVPTPGKADLCIVNTCAVTHVAARKSRQLLRRCHRSNPHALIVATGCLAEIGPEELRGLPGVCAVWGSSQKEHLVSLVAQRWLSEQSRPSRDAGAAPLLRTRALVKVQDGCDNRCSYCVVCVARGPQRSRQPADIIHEVATRTREGYQEVVLTGVNIGSYGGDCDSSLTALIRQILSSAAIPRLRLSSIEPWDIDPAFFDLFLDGRLCRHLHLPLQSGCDATLERMNRNYTTAQYRGLVDAARRHVPDVAITSDVMVGFPGEDDLEFTESAAFVEDLGLARVHVFPFSRRPGTAADAMPHQVPDQVRQARAQQMAVIGHQAARTFCDRFLERELQVLWEARHGPDWSGLTDNYIRVTTRSETDLSNRILTTRLTEVQAGAMVGVVVP